MGEGEILELQGSPEAGDLRWRGYGSRRQPIVVFDAKREQYGRKFILPKTDGISFGFAVQIVDFKS
jgi:hypothetical protein